MSMGDKFLKFRHYIFSHYRATTILISSFAFLILAGSILLTLPFANNGEGVSYIDHLFTATSATCVTGLVTVTVSEQYNLFGQFIILMLIQFGGLGLMTFISILLLLMHNRLEFKERMLLKDALNLLDFNDLTSYIRGIFKFTLSFELAGALILAWVFIPEYGIGQGIWHSVFLAVSAFCNAGIDCFGSLSILEYQSNPVVVLTIALLIIVGGLGFAVWFDLKAKLGLMIGFKRKLHSYHSKLRVYSRIVIGMTAFLIIIGTLLILVAEYNGALADLNFFEKILNAFFSSVTLRTAGFFTIDFTNLHRFTEIIMITLMFIGGSPGGTAGGIKTTTFFLLSLMVVSQIKKRQEIQIFKRRINISSFMSAFSVATMYFAVLFVALLILVCTEPFDTLGIIFEAVSAIGTVGLTTGITSALSIVGKIVIIALMFIGRVGPITIAYTLSKKNKKTNVSIKYPTTEILVG